MPDRPHRVLPEVTPRNEHFWRGGADGALRFLRCRGCGYWLHPPAPVCGRCLGRDLGVEAVSGDAVVASFTLNHQAWIAGEEVPYCIAIVELPEQAGLRLTTNVVGCSAEDVRIGMAVRVVFEEREDVWVPLFQPVPVPVPVPVPDPIEQPGTGTGTGTGTGCITGVGWSAIGRRLGKDPLELTIDACLAAMKDAGVKREEIDGIAAYPGGAVAAPAGYVGPAIAEVQDALRLRVDWTGSGLESSGPLGPFINACAAVAAGLARNVLCYCTVWESTAQGGAGRPPILPAGGRAAGLLQWTLPFRAYSAASWIALYAQRHFHDHGTTREQLAQVALNARRNAARNPDAVYRDPLALPQYLAARMVSTPLCMYDCDVPSDGAVALIVSRDARGRRPLRIESIGCALRGRPSWDQREDLSAMALRDASAMLWERTSLRPADVDVAELYDGFSFLTLAWLEALGFCAPGEGGRFVSDPGRIALDGDLPLQTGGGQLSGGRLNGYGLLRDACVELRGEAGPRQVPGDPRVAVVAAGGGPFAAALLLVKD